MQTVTNWERHGLPIAERGRKGRPSRYRLAEVQRWIRARETQRPSLFEDYQRAGARQKTALAELSELQLAERRKRLIDVDVVASAWMRVIAIPRTKILGVPHALKARHPDLGREGHRQRRPAHSGGVDGTRHTPPAHRATA